MKLNYCFLCTYILPHAWMPFMVRQWGGVDGEKMFDKLTHRKYVQPKITEPNK